MNKKLGRMVFSIAFLSFTGFVHAAEKPKYFGGNYSMVSAESAGIGADPTALLLKYGAFVTENIAVEGRLAFGMSDDTATVSGIDVNYEIDSAYGVYLRGAVSSGTFRPYGIIGFTKGEATLSASGFGSSSDSESDLSYGFGADMFFNENTALNIEYLQAIDKNDFEASMISVGVVFGF